MSVNSLESLLNRMKGRSITHGWGAVVALGMDQLNRLLQEQYLAWLHEGRFIAPISGEVFTDSRTESMKLDSLILGKPVLSFASASLNQSLVTLSMNIVAGTYTAISRPEGGAAHRLLSSFSITEDMGYKIEMKLSLNQITGEVDKRGRVTLDVASDPAMTCNLGGLPGVQRVVAAFIHSRLAALPVEQTTFELGLLDFNGNNPLSPTNFYIRTQKAPAGSVNPNDGAVLVFVRLKINEENGSLPIEGSDFPYLIPDDLTGGNRLYSASLVLNKDWIELLDDVQLDVLKNLLLPGENLFVESANGRHTPHDLLVLGNLKANDEHVTIQPSFINLKAGKTQAFSARKSDGSTVSAQWSVSNPVSPLSVGTITPTGLYSSPAQSRMGKEQQPVIVTARYTMGGVQQTSSALMLGVFESMSISPRVCTSGVGGSAAPIELAATTLGGGALQWPTLSPSEGTLRVVDNNNAIYTPPADLSDPLVIQTIRVTDSLTKETIDATIVLIKSAHTWPVDPPYVAAVSAATPIQLYADLEPEDARWTVIGEGEVDNNGLFTPPANPMSRTSVVRCSYLVNGSTRASGFTTIQLSEQERPDPGWSELQEFSIVASGANSCFSNGFQQIPVIIKIETKPVRIDGQDVYIPVSDANLSTLRLVDKLSNAPVPFIHVAQEGIEYGSGYTWAASKKRNRFRLYSPTVAVSNSVSLPTPQNNGVRYRELWIHLTAEGNRTFYAQFTSDHGVWNSTDEKSENYEVTVQGIRPPSPDIDHYEFKRDRVSQDPDGHDEPPNSMNPEWDYFSYYRMSIDYWRLSYRRLGGYPVLFSTSRIVDNVSSVQWESELVDETYFSYTGYAFNPANYENSDSPVPEGLSFDPYFWGLMRSYGKSLTSSFVKDKQPSPGQLLVSLHRTDDVKYWYDKLANGDKRKFYRQHLDPGVRFVLMDEEGNRHSLLVAFESPTQKDSRNKLTLRHV